LIMREVFRFRAAGLPTQRVTDGATFLSTCERETGPPPHDALLACSSAVLEPWSWLQPATEVQHAAPNLSLLADHDLGSLADDEECQAEVNDLWLTPIHVPSKFRMAQSQPPSSGRAVLSKGALRSSSRAAEEKHLQVLAAARGASGLHGSADHSATLEILTLLPSRIEQVRQQGIPDRGSEHQMMGDEPRTLPVPVMATPAPPALPVLSVPEQQQPLPRPCPAAVEPLQPSQLLQTSQSPQTPQLPPKPPAQPKLQLVSCDAPVEVLREAEIVAIGWSQGQPRHQVRAIRQTVTKAVGQISLVEDALARVAKLLSSNMATGAATAGETHFVQVLTARRLVEQCDVQVRKQPAFCWAVARIVAQCCEGCPGFCSTLEGMFFRDWPITIPDLDAACAAPCAADQHVAAARVWAAYLVWSGQIDRLWSWIARIVNAVPRGPAVVALHAVLCEAAWFLKQSYGIQFDKLLQALQSSYLGEAERVEHDAPRSICVGSAARLLIWLKCVALQGVSKPESSGPLQRSQTPISEHT